MSYFKNLGRFAYNLTIMVFARPSFQPFFIKLFRLNLGYLGYMNWSPDFKFTGERLALEKLRKFEINNILDIGANIGQWAEMALDTLDCEVISFEPQVLAFSKLQLLENKYGEKLKTFNLAIGDYDKKTEINVHIKSSELSFIDNRLNKMPLLTGQSGKKENIDMIKLDTLFQNKPELLKSIDFIKIDTEGFELNVLAGGLNFINSVSPRFIQLEINWHQLFVNSTLFNFSELLRNYNLYKILPSGEVFYKINPADPINNIFQLSNVIFVREDVAL